MSSKGFVKSRAGAPAGFYGVEAAGLSWLAEVPEGARVVRVIEVSDESMTVERVKESAPTHAAAVALGRGLARTHAAGASAYGVPPGTWVGNGFIGPLPLTHRACGSFGEFFGELRIRPFVRELRDAGTIDATESVLFDRVRERLSRGVIGGPEQPPSRIHGDLWNGNVLWSAEGAVLIDPAAHGGHRESDLAMLALFGLPFLEPLLAAYHEAHPLADGWRKRVGLHQLYPLLVHAVLFGRGYAQRALTIAESYY
ncbi:MAG: fructosamine kinase family protein [Actinomycetales bacterium]